MTTTTTTKKQKLGPLQRKWLRELRSGKYRQTTGVLFNGRGYCCLGVAARFVCGVEPKQAAGYPTPGEFWFNGAHTDLPDALRRKLGLRTVDGKAKDDEAPALTLLNDGDADHDGQRVKRHRFRQIADILEANPRAYFKRSA